MENENIYFFVLGTNHTLSKIDIVNMLLRKGVDFEIVEASEEVIVVRTKEKLAVGELMAELGSAVKVGQVFRVYLMANFPNNFLEEVKSLEFKTFFLPSGSKAKIRFGISVYQGGAGFKELNKAWFLTPKIAREIGRLLEINSLAIKTRELTSVVVDKTGLLTDGFELILIIGRQRIYVGKTLLIQDYEGYSQRDYGRPARDPRAGMIPPKLARIMINLANKGKSDLFLDSFCGSGTILQELVMLGYHNLVGTDSSKKSIVDTQTNLNWLFGKFNLKKTDFKIKLAQVDVKKLSSVIAYKTVWAIVTEPYLGSPQVKYFGLGQIKKEINKLEKLYLAAFGEFRKVLKDEGVVVIIFPVFRFKKEFYHLEILNELEKLGFATRSFLNQKILGEEILALQITSRNSVIFFRPGQVVSREIFIFVKNNFSKKL